jgi:hypothetical protein
MRLLLSLFFMLASIGLARAQSSLQNNLTAQKPPTFSGNLASTYNSNLMPRDSYDYESSLSADLIMNYRVQGANLVRAYLGGQKEFTQGEEWKPNDGFISWVNNAFWMRSKKLTIGQQMRLSLPLSRESKERDSKITGVSLVPIFMVTLTPSFMVIYLPQLSRDFHTYEQNRLQKNNIEYSVNNLLVGIWSLTDRLYWQGVTGHRQAWSYGGTQRDPFYSFSSELGFSLPNNFTIAAGWSNSGNIRRVEQGVDQSFEIFNNNTSTVYSAVYWIF